MNVSDLFRYIQQNHHIILLTFFILVIGCQNEEPEQIDSFTGRTLLPPADTLPKEAKDQIPAFENQTRVPGIKTQTPIKTEFITQSLAFPWGLEFLPDQRMIVTEKPGRIRIVTQEGIIGDSIANVPEVHFERDGGLLDIALDPSFKENRLLYFAYSEPYEGEFTPTIARARLSDDERSLEEVKVIYRVEHTNHLAFHYGARLLFDPEGYLLACFGERMLPEIRVKSQDLKSALGKVIRIQTDGSPAPEGPFQVDTAKSEIIAYGFRDPQGLAFHPETGDLWLSDHGPLAGDEINIVEYGQNYGWPIISYGTEYNRDPVGEGLTQKEGLVQPVYYWDPAISPSGIAFYNGDLIPEWKGNLFVTALRGMHVARLVIEDNEVIREERLLNKLGMRFRDVIEGPDGALYLLTDMPEGSIIRLAPE